MTESPTTQELLKDMAQLTALSGRISDVQAKNLQYFPLVFFDHVSEVKIDYDLSPIKTMDDSPTFSNSLVSYYLTMENPQDDNLEKRFKALETSVRTLFWSDVKIEVFFNDIIVYKSLK
jgi:hypothetical protein